MSSETRRTSSRAAVTVQPCPHSDSVQSSKPDEHREDCVLWSTDDGLKWFQIVGFQRVEPPYELTVRQKHAGCDHPEYSDIEPTLRCEGCGNRVPFHHPCCTRNQPTGDDRE